MHLLLISPPDPPDSLSRNFIVSTQASHSEAGESFDTDEGGLHRTKNIIRIPCTAGELKFKLLTVAHAGQAGHHRAETTTTVLRGQCYWKRLTTDAKVFLWTCLLCALLRRGKTFHEHSHTPYMLMPHASFCNLTISSLQSVTTTINTRWY